MHGTQLSRLSVLPKTFLPPSVEMSVSPQQKTQLVFFNSKYATRANNNTANSDVTFILPRPIQKPPGTNLGIKVQQMVYPVSWYTVTAANNRLAYSWGGVAMTDIVLPVGNWTATELLDYFNLWLAGSVTLAYDEKAMIFTFTDTIAAVELAATSTCLSLLGFTEGQDHTSTLVGGVHTLVSGLVDLSPTKCIYVSVPNLSINNLIGHTGQPAPILASIPVTQGAGDVEVYINDTGLESVTQEDTISEFHIKILDQDLSLVNFNNNHWQLTLQITFSPS